MSYMILVDEQALKECVESSIYQSEHFEAGERLARALCGDTSVTIISQRLVPHWTKDTLYLLQSRTETGYLLFDASVFPNVPQVTQKDGMVADRLVVFQRVCRFALKVWNCLTLSSPMEKWSTKTDCGVVFPFPKSKQTGFRISVRKGYEHRRSTLRHGSRHLFAFAAGTDEVTSNADHERSYKRAFEGLSDVRTSIEVHIHKVESIPQDHGYHPLVLSGTGHGSIRYQEYDKWLPRLTAEQSNFVTSSTNLPQRVEGPAGTGKTLCLLLRAHHLCRVAAQQQTRCKLLFVSHNDATRDAVRVMLHTLGDPDYLRDSNDFAQSIEVRTLQEWCGNLLGERDLAQTQYLDQDAIQAKEMRKLLIKDIVSARREKDKTAFEYLSKRCRALFEDENADYLAELLQHEIGVMIKGRASEDIDQYVRLPHLSYCLPAETENDRRFVYALYKEYQRVLNESGVFDTDDIVLTALGRLDTPIWRRRRMTEGYDAIIIDETQLFNLNELSVFHFLLRDIQRPQIVFSIDRSQAPGERGITTKMVREVLTGTNAKDHETRTKLIFRCAPEIVKLAEAVTSAGATLFTTFENPLVDASTLLLASDEAAATVPVYWQCGNDLQMCKWATSRVAHLCNDLKCPPSDVLIVGTSEGLLPMIIQSMNAQSIRHVEILRRGDLETVRRGEQQGAVIISHPDYVGGLEFKAVLIVGVDEGRVPPTEGAIKEESRHFLEFKACNRLYVAISRARLCVEMFFSAQRGPTSLLEHAKAIDALVMKQAQPM